MPMEEGQQRSPATQSCEPTLVKTMIVAGTILAIGASTCAALGLCHEDTATFDKGACATFYAAGGAVLGLSTAIIAGRAATKFRQE